MPNPKHPLTRMAEYASQCYMTDVCKVGEIVKPDNPPRHSAAIITKQKFLKSPKMTDLDFQVSM